jgi:hypothetical protein
VELERIVADDFVEFGTSGRTFTKTDAIAALIASPASSSASLDDFRVTVLAPTVALATYRTPKSLRCSIWRKSGAHWQIVFHQGTPTAT